ncbi:RraA family protein [Roseibium sp. HPY-6]|uniref:RraA family protein n=1 Tax=Roseibium sp. HPY-6 TaxID=3229852 RepID=UPI00338F47E9
MLRSEIETALSSLTGVETATIGHFMTEGFLDPEISAIVPQARIFGTAFTCRFGGDDGTALVHAVSEVEPGQIIVVDRMNDRKHACWGAVMTVAAQERGAVGAVIDGYITDRAAIVEAGFPIWCRGFSPITTKIGKGHGSIRLKIKCGNVVLKQDDVVLADENGVVVLNPEDVAAIAAKAHELQGQEPKVIEQLRKGKSYAEINPPPELFDHHNDMPPK